MAFRGVLNHPLSGDERQDASQATKNSNTERMGGTVACVDQGHISPKNRFALAGSAGPGCSLPSALESGLQARRDAWRLASLGAQVCFLRGPAIFGPSVSP